ncbi:uncharacterized protein TNCV_1355791 [Trichonephila clavipes]|uniref:Uncharacterized protein n=1 Tax=Trichonephila clavipes TaxID=2585209 RepID=A0A8X6SGT5_TRICX|nr:uncharacterized protein TNCV_1355791 [Trichonephila clavipes]
MVSDGTEFAVGDIEKLFEEDRRNTKAKHEKWAKYYDRRRNDVQIKVNDWVLIKTDLLSSATKKVVAKFKPKFEDSYRVLEKDQGETHTSIASNRRPLVRSSPGSWTEPNRRTKKCRKETLGFKRSWQSGLRGPERKYKKSPRQQGAERKFSVNSNDLPYFRKRGRRDETVLPSTSVYNSRPRRGAKLESLPPSEKRTQQGGPVQKKEAGRNHSTDPMPRSKEGQEAGIPEAQVVQNSITRRGKKERTATEPSP